MSQPDDAYTIVIFRGSTAKPLRFSFPLKMVKRAAIVGVVLLVGQLALLAQYVIRTSQVWELQTLRQELTIAKEQTTAFATSLEDLKKRVQAMKDVNEKLRVMLGLDRLKPEDYLNGQGGDETPVNRDNQGGQDISLEAGDGEGTSGSQSSVTYQFWAQDLADQVRHKIVWLQQEAVTQERSLEQLTVVAKERSTRWGSTPSVWPVKGWITSGFGPRTSPFTGQLAMHDGLDIGAAPNAPIFAPASGRIAVVGFDPRMGNVVAIEHGYGIETQYGHLARVLVKNGQRVKRGEMLGLVGSTGLSTGPHLHYMVKVNHRPVNPRRYILD
jgi:murein DD-endopeptidase MepM/ murein hydrolase activator NlpD